MQTTGNGNETLMILVPVASLVVAIILLGGPTEALEAVNAIAGEIAYLAMTSLKALL